MATPKASLDKGKKASIYESIFAIPLRRTLVEKSRILPDWINTSSLISLFSHHYHTLLHLICKVVEGQEPLTVHLRPYPVSTMSAKRYDREPAYNDRRPFGNQYRGDRNGRMYEDQYYRSRSKDRYQRSRSPRERYSSPHGKPQIRTFTLLNLRPC